jgi:hypothetical protein
VDVLVSDADFHLVDDAASVLEAHQHWLEGGEFEFSLLLDFALDGHEEAGLISSRLARIREASGMVSLILNTLIKVDRAFKNALRSDLVLSERYLPVERLVESRLGDSPGELNSAGVFPVKTLLSRLELLLRLSLEGGGIVFEVFTCKERFVLSLSDALDALHIRPVFNSLSLGCRSLSLGSLGHPYVFWRYKNYRGFFFTALGALRFLLMDVDLLLATTYTEADTNQKSADDH